MEKNKLSIREYFEKGNFEIPNYQRGYKWGVIDEKGICAVSVLVENLITAFDNRYNEYFLEAVTVVEEGNKIIIVDGQQRTTTLYLLFIALGLREKISNIVLDYEVREDSKKYLKALKANSDLNQNEENQDIYFFNEVIRRIQKITKNKIEKNPDFNIDILGEFILDKVHLLYNVIVKDKAITTFISLNGLKAIMKDEELIKSDLLIKSSRSTETSEIRLNMNCEDSCLLSKTIKIIEERNGLEWKINEDRGRLARNWDKWIYWWNKKGVRDFFGTGNSHPLYYLLRTYWNQNEGRDKKSTFDFDNFKKDFIKDNVSAKNTFERLRKLQKSFEDLYNNYETYNYLGLVFKTSNVDKEEAIQYFMKTKETELLKEYAVYRLAGVPHLETIRKEVKKFEDGTEEVKRLRKAKDAIELISQKYVYWDEKDKIFPDGRQELAFNFLLLLNVLEDNNLKRKFNFSIWNKRSLEHIYPKSLEKVDGTKLNFFNAEMEKQHSVHCIGNLVLLYVNNNSTFGAKSFDEKKQTYFNTSEIEFESRNLIHTLSVFASKKWDASEIIENKEKTIKNLYNIYGIIK